MILNTSILFSAMTCILEDESWEGQYKVPFPVEKMFARSVDM